MTYPVDGSDLRQMAFETRNVEVPLKIIYGVIQNVRNASANAEGIKDITERGSIRANLDNINKAIDMGLLPDMKEHFQSAADRQEQYWSSTRFKKEIVAEFPHHEFIIWSEEKDEWTSISPLVRSPLSYTFGAIVTNPYSLDKTPQENIDFVTDLDRITRTIDYLSERSKISKAEISEAVSVYCDTFVGKRAWSIVNKGQIEAGQVGPEHFIAVGNAVRASGYCID